MSQPDGVVKDYVAILAKYELPEPPGAVIGARRITRLDDWYVQTAEGWYWLDARDNKWVFSPMGPIE